MYPVASDNSLQSVRPPDDTGQTDEPQINPNGLSENVHPYDLSNVGTSSHDDDVMDMRLQFSNTEDGQVPELTDTVDISPIMEAPETDLNAGDGGRDDHTGESSVRGVEVPIVSSEPLNACELTVPVYKRLENERTWSILGVF
ncbi:hypothetical protein V6N11_077813 [Hibiscus sabdariffa]|uniref:Uncharacterized protein n=1 Tax=Hibiscus sabdariffa TaxID=183260 RepID=A0ABR2TF33_9ROSI